MPRHRPFLVWLAKITTENSCSPSPFVIYFNHPRCWFWVVRFDRTPLLRDSGLRLWPISLARSVDIESKREETHLHPAGFKTSATGAGTLHAKKRQKDHSFCLFYLLSAAWELVKTRLQTSLPVPDGCPNTHTHAPAPVRSATAHLPHGHCRG